MCEYNIIRNDIVFCTVNNKPCPVNLGINPTAYVSSSGCPMCKGVKGLNNAKWWKG